MRTSSLVAMLLVGLSTRLKDACKTTERPKPSKVGNAKEKLYPIPDEAGGKKPDYYLAIIGGGPQAAAVLARLSRSILKRLRLVVVETKATFATGVPYDPNVATPVHLLNVFAPEAVSITGDKEDFTKWAKKWKNRKYAGILKDYKKTLSGRTPPNSVQRIIFGKYLSDRFEDFVKKCRGKKYKVDLMNDTTAEKVSPHPGGIGYVIALDKGAAIHALNVFVATGHFYKSRFGKHVEGYYKSPWPASDLLDEDTGVKEEHIGSLGNSLTAVDALMTVAHKFGKFNADNTVFETFSKHSEFKMTLYSRGGQLPTVHRYTIFSHRPEEMTLSNSLIFSAVADGRRFDADFGLMKEDIVKLLPAIGGKGNVDDMKVKEFFEHLDNVMEPTTDSKQNFLDDVDNKLNQVHIKLRSLFYYADDIFRGILDEMSAEEYILYKKYIAPRIKKASTVIPLTNAKKLAALMKKHLFLETVGHDCKITEKDDGQGVNVTYGDHEIPHNYFIEATGQDGYIRRDPRNLTQSLLDSGLARPYLFLFRDQEYARKLNDSLVQGDGVDRTRVVFRVGKFYYEGDGVIMDKRTGRVVPRPGLSTEGSIYAGAPFTFGYYPGLQNLKMATVFASRAIADMQNYRSNFFFN